MTSSRQSSGFSLVEVIIVSAVMVLFFTGLITMVIYVMDLVQNARAKLSALSVATERIEYIRSLPYDSVGTISGLPPGVVPQNRTVVLNNYTFSERVLIEYFDDDADGVWPSDSNGISEDYKRVKVEYSWNVTGATSTLTLISTVVPRSVESTTGGGTIRVNVFDAAVAPVSGAAVRLYNNTGTTTVDVTRFTDLTGMAQFSGAPAGSNYQIFVSKAGYSSDQTHVATTSNPIPVTLPITVLEADVSTMNFAIDRVADLDITVFSTITENEQDESFDNLTGVATTTNATVLGGELLLAENGPGVYPPAGSAYLVPVTPGTILRFEALSWTVDRPVGTEARVRLYTGTSSSYVLIPDSDLPGNAAGFTERLVDLRDLSVVTYPEFSVGITLETTDSTVTPTVDQATVYYREASTPRAGAAYSLRGSKVIGTDLSASPVYKFTQSGLLDGGGTATFPDREWDLYHLTLTNNSLRMVCPHPYPLSLLPNTPLTVEMIAAPSGAHNARVVVVDAAGVVIPGATVTLSRPGYSDSAESGVCGQAFFGSLGAEVDYQVAVSAAGFTSVTLTDLTVSGASVFTVTLTPS